MSSNQLPTDSIRLIGNENLTTIQSYLLAEDQRHDSESETFTWVLSAISLAAKFIAAKVRCSDRWTLRTSKVRSNNDSM